MCAMFKPNQTSFKKGQIPWNKGKTLPTWYRKKLSKSRLESKHRTGKLHPRWKGGKRGYYNDIGRKILVSKGVKQECVNCGFTGTIHLHHKDGNWKNNKADNLVFLCISCHIKLHHKIRAVVKGYLPRETANYLKKYAKLQKGSV